MDAPYATGSDDRDGLAPDHRCEACGCALYDDELDAKQSYCRRCLADALDAEAADRSAA